MKSILVIASILLSLAACKDNNSEPSTETATPGKLSADLVHNPNSLDSSQKMDPSRLGKLVFKDTLHAFGRIQAGEKVNYEFSYTNEGNSDVLIYSARASCGCTIPEYNHDAPIKPGESGVIKVNFNSEGKEGHQRKNILVSTNGTPADIELFIEADVY